MKKCDHSIKLTLLQEQELKDYMSTVLDQIQGINQDDSIGILLNELATWKIWQTVNMFPLEFESKNND